MFPWPTSLLLRNSVRQRLPVRPQRAVRHREDTVNGEDNGLGPGHSSPTWLARRRLSRAWMRKHPRLSWEGRLAMIFRDQSHIDRVREALWSPAGEGASVLVGSGLSRNAQAARPGASGPPLLGELVNGLSRALYPEPDSAKSASGPAPASGFGAVERLAQEYETASGGGEGVKPDGTGSGFHALCLPLMLPTGDDGRRVLRLGWLPEGCQYRW